jgi:alkylation response protein AidB-like acyl-CoA dehydrogenase
MNLDPTETQRVMQENLGGLLEGLVPFDRVRALEREQGLDDTLWRALAAKDWLGLPFAERHGGGGGGLVDLGLLVECLARRAVLVPMLEVAVCGQVLAAAPEQRPLLDALMTGEAIVVPALLEATDRFDRISLGTDASGRITGEKYFVDYGQHATHHLVAALLDGVPGLHLVDVRGGDVAFEPLRGLGRTPACVARYQDAPSQRIGDAAALHELVQLARLLAAVQCVGSLSEALDQTVRYARVREQFGKPIGSFQAVRHHCANMAIRVAAARHLAFEALSRMDAGERDPVRVAAAKAAASRAAPEVLMLAHQIHGGNGMIEENDLYFFTLRGKERSLAWGTVEECLDVMAGQLDRAVDWL